jgi:MinD superfamily P-loop ATPase
MSATIQECVIISGKGGTGKTSVTASFAALSAGRAVLADCDVDAADLHLVLTPKIIESTDFRSGNEAVIRSGTCTGCGTCAELCRFDAIHYVKRPFGKALYEVAPVACEGCGVCVRFCPAQAIAFPERLCGEWMLSETRCGPMVHACLCAAAENSGKLVATVRQEARRVAKERGLPLIITDGPPGIGCPVIASVTGADRVLVVTEPTVSGEHDLARVLRAGGAEGRRDGRRAHPLRPGGHGRSARGTGGRRNRRAVSAGYQKRVGDGVSGSPITTSPPCGGMANE